MRQRGEWSVERQMDNGSWYCFGQGYLSAATAKSACKYHAPLQGHAKYRISDGEVVYRATLNAGERAKWIRDNAQLGTVLR